MIGRRGTLPFGGIATLLGRSELIQVAMERVVMERAFLRDEVIIPPDAMILEAPRPSFDFTLSAAPARASYRSRKRLCSSVMLAQLPVNLPALRTSAGELADINSAIDKRQRKAAKRIAAKGSG